MRIAFLGRDGLEGGYSGGRFREVPSRVKTVYARESAYAERVIAAGGSGFERGCPIAGGFLASTGREGPEGTSVLVMPPSVGSRIPPSVSLVACAVSGLSSRLDAGIRIVAHRDWFEVAARTGDGWKVERKGKREGSALLDSARAFAASGKVDIVLSSKDPEIKQLGEIEGVRTVPWERAFGKEGGFLKDPAKATRPALPWILAFLAAFLALNARIGLAARAYREAAEAHRERAIAQAGMSTPDDREVLPPIDPDRPFPGRFIEAFAAIAPKGTKLVSFRLERGKFRAEGRTLDPLALLSALVVSPRFLDPVLSGTASGGDFRVFSVSGTFRDAP